MSVELILIDSLNVVQRIMIRLRNLGEDGKRNHVEHRNGYLEEVRYGDY